MGMLIYILALVLSLYVHEVGHAVVALALGFRVHQVSIGSGAVLLRVRAGTAWLVLRALPFDGCVRVLPRPGRHTLATACLILGGVLGNAALFVLTAVVATVLAEHARHWHTTLVLIGGTQVLVIVANLLPYGIGEHESDGLALLNLLRHRTDDGLELGRYWADLVGPPDGPPLPVTQALPELSYQATSYLHDDDAWVRQDARAALERMVRLWQLTGLERAVALGALGLGGLDLGGLGLGGLADEAGPSPAQLDAWTQDGMALAPTPWMQAARARALSALGRHREAMDLAAAASRAPLHQQVAVGVRLLIADAAARLGFGDSALAWLADARQMAAGGPTRLHQDVAAMADSVAAINAAVAGYGPDHALLVSLTGKPDAVIQPPSPDFPEILRLWTLSNSTDVPDAKRQANAALPPLLGHALPVAERAFVLGLLSLNGLTHETGASDGDLDRWSSEALALAATPALRVVRAGVLVRLGRWADGMRLAAAETALRPSERALAHLFVSLAAARLGEATAAATWLDLARTAAGGEAALRVLAGRLVDAATDAADGGRPTGSSHE